MESTDPAAQGTMVTEQDPDGATVVRIAGEVDLSNVEPLRGQLTRALAEARGPIVFDLAELEFIDSSGLALLLLAIRHPPGVQIRATSEIVRRVIDVSGLSTVLGLAPA